jgi:hypothetical protein
MAITAHQILHSDNVADLDDQIAAAIADGWDSGGDMFSQLEQGSVLRFYKAMVKGSPSGSIDGATADIATLQTTYRLLGMAAGVDLNNVADTPITLIAGTKTIRQFVATNASASMATSAATLGAYTAAAAGGTAVVTPATMTGLTAATKRKDHTIADATDVFTLTTLYARNGIVHGAALTCDVYVLGELLAAA